MGIAARILLVDDRPANLVALRAGLSGCCCEIVEALSGAAALEEAEKHDFAAILLDVQMPVIDGYEVARKIRSGATNRSAPIIFLTAIEREEKYERLGYDVGAVDYLFKPLHVDILRSKINIFLELYRKSEENLRQAELLKEAALREQENEFLKRAIELRDDFLSMAVHELSTPITPLNLQIQAFLEMYRNGTLREAPRETVLRLLETSEEQVRRLARLVGDLVDVSRMKSGKIQLRREKLDFVALVDGILQSFRQEIESVCCETSFSAEGEATGYWDAFRLEQVVINLLKNSLKYGAGKPVELKLRSEGGIVLFSVRDHGIGINSADQARIFGRFERAASAQHYGGLGLGLFITDQIVRLHGGEILVTSEPNRGAEFTVRLPTSTA